MTNTAMRTAGWWHWFFLAWVVFVVLFIAVVFFFPRERRALENEPVHLAKVINSSRYGYFEVAVDPRHIKFDLQQQTLTDSRTAFSIQGKEVIELSDRCAVEVLIREPLFVVSKLCDVVFVVAHDFTIRAIMTDEVYENRGPSILCEIREDVPRHICQILDGIPFLTFDDAVDSSWIQHDSKERFVQDNRTGFRMEDEALIRIGGLYEPRTIEIHRDLSVIGLSHLHFVVGEDWVVHAITTESDFEERGDALIQSIWSDRPLSAP